MKRYLLLLVVFSFAACAPKANVMIQRTGAMLPPKAAGCDVYFINNEASTIYLSGQAENLAMISISGSEDVVYPTPEMFDAVRKATCQLGGNAYSLLQAVSTGAGQSIIQFQVWQADIPDDVMKKANEKKIEKSTAI